MAVFSLKYCVVVLACYELLLSTVSSAIVGNKSLLEDSEDECEDFETFGLPDGEESLHEIGPCAPGSTSFEIRNRRLGIVYETICHDKMSDQTYWTRHRIFGPLLDRAPRLPCRPPFEEGEDFYQTIDANLCYSKEGQKDTISELLGPNMGEYYIRGGSLYLARGHFSPVADKETLDKKKATFYYINASPQWQIINNGNWKTVERKIQDRAKESRSTYTIYTGTYGVTTLNDIQGRPVEIWLGRDHNTGATVNSLMWKIIHDEIVKQAVAVITVNNPYVVRTTPTDIICEDICASVPWLEWDTRTVFTRGYTYCCSVQSLCRSIPYAPNLGNLPLLK